MYFYWNYCALNLQGVIYFRNINSSKKLNLLSNVLKSLLPLRVQISCVEVEASFDMCKHKIISTQYTINGRCISGIVLFAYRSFESTLTVPLNFFSVTPRNNYSRYIRNISNILFNSAHEILHELIFEEHLPFNISQLIFPQVQIHVFWGLIGTCHFFRRVFIC